ncbi:MAG: hypothetical protein WB630_08175, partial [Candidatus Acidiferrales bacterium]
LFLYSRGIPRVLNLLCEQSLMRAASETIRPVPGRIVGEAAQDFQYDAGRMFSPGTSSDEGYFSGLFASRPVHAEASEVLPAGPATISPEVPARSFAPEAASAGSSQTHTFSSQLARLPMSGGPQSSTAPIMFSSRSQRFSGAVLPHPVGGHGEHLATGTPPDLLIAELSTVSRQVAPQLNPRTKVSDPPKRVRPKHRKDRPPSIANQMQAVSKAMKSKARLLLHQLRPALGRGRATVLRHLHVWRNGIRHAVARVNLAAIAGSSLKWLRAPSGGTQPHRTAVKPRGTLPATTAVAPGASSRVEASRTRQNCSQPALKRSIPDSKYHQTLNNPRIASLLNWLQQPTGTSSNRQGTRPTNSRIA